MAKMRLVISPGGDIKGCNHHHHFCIDIVNHVQDFGFHDLRTDRAAIFQLAVVAEYEVAQDDDILFSSSKPSSARTLVILHR